MGLAAELSRQDIEVVGVLHGFEEGISSWSFRDLLEPSSELLAECSPWLAPIPPAILHEYLEGLARLSPVPGAREVETLRISPITNDQAHDLAHVHAALLSQILRQLRPDMVWFLSMPHLGIDALLRYLAEQVGIRSIGFRQSRIKGRYLAYDLDKSPWQRIDADSSEPHEQGAVLPAVVPVVRRKKSTQEWIEVLKFYLGGFLSSSRERVFHRLHQGAYWRKRFRSLFLLDLLDRRTRGVAYERYVREKIYARTMRQCLRSAPNDLPEKFVYFPLHLEPEANTSIFAGPYSNQMLALECLANSLPPGWKLLLRENPKQAGAWRSSLFFDRLGRLGGVEFSRHPAALLMKRCSVVATICGSAGYEAVRLGKPAVYFGDPWYAGLHGTFEFNDQLDLEELAEKPVCRQALDLSANRLISRFHQGVVFSRDFALYSDYLPEHFASITARSLRAIADRALGTVAVD
jgi:hypothetical protein